MMVEGYRYVALVATDPGYQRRGYADAAMRRALELSATVVHRSAYGAPRDRCGAAGLRTNGVHAHLEHTIFMAKEFLAGH